MPKPKPLSLGHINAACRRVPGEQWLCRYFAIRAGEYTCLKLTPERQALDARPAIAALGDNCEGRGPFAALEEY